MSAPASVVVRTSNPGSPSTVLDDLARQTVRPEITVVDSGSTDGTRALVTGRCDRLVEAPRHAYHQGGRSTSAAARRPR